MSVQDERVLHLETTDQMVQILEEKGRPLSTFRKGQTIEVWNKMQKNYSYILSEAPGKGFDPDFKPHLTPGEMMRLGVFEGKYLNDCLLEYPAEWFIDAIGLGKLSPVAPNTMANLFQIKSRQPLSTWVDNGWAPSKGKGHPKQYAELADTSKNPDERGWFQWYCRYWMGRRLPKIDAIQIERWKAFSRHAGQIKANCSKGELECRPRQRQALLQWAWNPFL